jgi:predicted nucleic acid-binding protein
MNVFGCDTNLFIYGLLPTFPQHSQALRIISDYQVVITDQVCLEISNVLARESVFSHIHSEAFIQDILEMPNVHLLQPNNETLMTWLKWRKKYSLTQKTLFDAYLAATYYSHGITSLVTYNEKDFKKISEISLISPSSL